MKYRIIYEFLNCLGDWVEDALTNNGEGFTQEEAEQLVIGLNDRYDYSCIQTRNARMALI